MERTCYQGEVRRKRKLWSSAWHSLQRLTMRDSRVEDDVCLPRIPEPLLSNQNHDDDEAKKAIEWQEEAVCRIEDSPFHSLKLAGTGKLKELEIHLMAHPDQLYVTDCKKRSALHWTAKRGHARVIEYLISQGLDVNAVDCCGCTALHHAAEHNQAASVDALIAGGANSDLKNNANMAAIHVAVDLDRKTALQALVRHKSVDVDQGADNGRTPLHYAAHRNLSKCAQILLDAGARMCKKDDLEKYPVHLAAENGSSGVLRILLRWAETMAYKGEGMLKFVNQEKHTPLHVAVNSGDLMAVKTCLEAGANIDLPQDDGSTAVHLAASQGSVEMLSMMLSCQPDKKEYCMSSVDVTKHTALHKAALFDRAEAITFLLSEGSDIEARDQEDQTPLLLAASKRAWQAVLCLIQHGASIYQRDAAKRNLIHLIIEGGGRPTDLKICFQKPETKALLNERDGTGCTPLHYASQGGQLSTINVLLNLGALHNAKNNNMESPLHFASRYGRYNTCRRLLENTSGSTINETDGSGHTPLHLAAQNGHTKVVVLLLQHGAGLFRDLNGNTPLHLVAENGYSHTAREILNIHSHLINSPNKDGNTPLHLAAKNGFSHLVTALLDMDAKFLRNKDSYHFMDLAIDNEQKEVAIAVISNDRWKEVMELGSEMFGCPITGTIKKMPDVTQLILDRCRTPSGPDCKHKDFHYLYNFVYLQANINCREKLKQDENYIPLHALNVMVEYNRVDCLSHPVCSTYLKMKWMAFGLWFHLFNLLVYLVFLTSLTIFVTIFEYDAKQEADVYGGRTGNESEKNDTSWQNSSSFDLHSGQRVLVITIIAFCFLNALKEIVQIVQQRWLYLYDANNALEWVLYITSALFIAPFMFGHSTDWQWKCGAIAIFLAWFNLLIFLQRFDFFGIYVVMFLVILKTLVQVLIVFSILIVAFGFTFFILLHQSESGSRSHSNPAISMVTTIVMMLGNIDYIDGWVDPHSEDELPYEALNFLMLVVFVLLMPILLINLLIGLAVGDIETVQKDARLKRIAMQVQFISYIEERLPKRLIEWVDKTEMKVFPNCEHYSVIGKWFTKPTTSPRHDDCVEIESEMEHKNFLYLEMHKQKRRLKQIQTDMAKQHDLLRLVIQKMEIRTEADDIDQNDSLDLRNKASQQDIGWSSPNLRQALMKQAIVSKWRSKDES